jgi:hypothetical protein
MTRAGHIIQVVNTCVAAPYLVESLNTFTSQMTIQPWLIGSREWKSSFGNTGYGQRRGGCLHSAWTSNVQLIAWTAAAVVCFSISLTLWLRKLSYRSSLSRVAISVTSILSIIASLISLNNIGVQQNLNTVHHQDQAHLKTWKLL